MNKPIQVGLVGLGVIAQTHLAVLAERLDVELDFTVDPHTEPIVFREELRPHYHDLTKALAHHEPDLVVIATPADSHAELATQILTTSRVMVLSEKPLTIDLADLDRLREVGAQGRLFTAHHFAFSPEVRWAAKILADHPEWGAVTAITSAFYDPYVVKCEQAFTSYLSGWVDSGINQLSMLSQWVDLTAVTSPTETDDDTSAWALVSYRCRDIAGTARLRVDWHASASSKSTVLVCGKSGVEIWLNHTAMTGFAYRSNELLAECRDNGQTPRLIAHYRPLYESLLSDRPDVILNFDTTARITELHSKILDKDYATTK